MNDKILQIIDANFNRTREGLRVCEDITRFVLANKGLAQDLKSIRHSVTRSVLNSKKIKLDKLLVSRDTQQDPLKFFDIKRKGRCADDIFMSNIERVKESLRVLEECSKIIDESVSVKFRKLRFKTYDVEKRFVKTNVS